jgi:threonine dehydrogenase-like Zn-dependent dehydrogenase
VHCNTYRTWEAVLRLLDSGQLDVAPLIVPMPLAAWQAGFEGMEALRIVKAVLLPNGPDGAEAGA